MPVCPKVFLGLVVLTGDLDREPPLCRGCYCLLDLIVGFLATFYCTIDEVCFVECRKLSLPRTDCPKAIAAQDTLSRIVPSSSSILKLLIELPSESEPIS